jgi:hypothetical protein
MIMQRISEKVVTIRKSRKCFGCLKPIKKGEKALIQTNADDGEIYSITLCNTCRKKLSQLHYDDEFCEGELKEF